jgi:hypothetical protein
MWTVYDHPRDNPQHYVARLFYVGKQGSIATAISFASTNLDELRARLEDLGLIRLHRDPKDDPVIMETWL